MADVIFEQLITLTDLELQHTINIIQMVHDGKMFELYEILRAKDNWFAKHRNKFCGWVARLLYNFIINGNTDYVTHLYNLLYHGTDIGLYQIIITKLFEILYNEQQLELVSENKWIVMPRNFDEIIFNSHTYSFINSADKKISLNIIQYLIINHQQFTVSHIWTHISHLFRSGTVDDDNIICIIKLCTSNKIPLLDDFLHFAWNHVRFRTIRYQIFDTILESGVIPLPRTIGLIFFSHDLPIMRLFVKYNINIKNILHNTQKPDYLYEMNKIICDLDIDLFDYIAVTTFFITKN